MTNYKCPICGKSGLPDFRKESVVCPACNTDLSAYVIINADDSDNKIWKVLFSISVIAILFLSFILYSKKPQPVAADSNVQQLKDSIVILSKNNSILIRQISETNYLYPVRKGDSFYKISKLYYGSEKYGKEIAKLNGMELDAAIYPGTSLKLPKK